MLAKQGRIGVWHLPVPSQFYFQTFFLFFGGTFTSCSTFSSSSSLPLFSEEDRDRGISSTSMKRSSCGNSVAVAETAAVVLTGVVVTTTADALPAPTQTAFAMVAPAVVAESFTSALL